MTHTYTHMSFIASESRIEVFRPGDSDYSWMDFPSYIDLVVIDFITDTVCQLFFREKPVESNKIVTIQVTVRKDSVSASIDHELLSVRIEGNIYQALFELIKQTYKLPHKPEAILLDYLPNVAVRKTIQSLPEYSIEQKELQASNDNRVKETMVALLRYTKDPDVEGFTLEGLTSILAPLYSENMRLKDVVTVVTNTYLEMLSIPEFKMSYRGSYPDIIKNLIFAPVNSVSHFPNTLTVDDSLKVKDFYFEMIRHMLNEIMMCNVGWCRDKVFLKTD